MAPGDDFLDFVDEVAADVGGYDKQFETPYIDTAIKKRDGTEVPFRLFLNGGKFYHMIRIHREPYRKLEQGEKQPRPVLCTGEDDYCRRAKEFKASGDMKKAAALGADRQFWFSGVLVEDPATPRIWRATQGNARKAMLLCARAGGYQGSDEVAWEKMTDSFKAALRKGVPLVCGNEGRDISIRYNSKAQAKKMYSVDLRPKEDSPALSVDESKFRDLSVAAVEEFEEREDD